MVEPSAALLKHYQGTTSQSFIGSGAQLLATVLITFDIVGPSVENKVDLATAAGLVDCLLAFLKGSRQLRSLLANHLLTLQPTEPTSPDVSKSYIADAAAFVERLVSCLFTAQSLERTLDSDELVTNCFAVLLEASLHCPGVWGKLKSAGQFTALLRGIILEDTQFEVRAAAADRLKGIFSVLPT